ncbi:damage-control phosphatase ARMT1 family protein [Kiritimatiella glycovorans]|uniref:Damage-control phosphatase ARMT1-like metal-binding domain-containing protein n=1 Tax=Kiritimatiella glycovorans TaxID=1307763 RepID=A0A0G3EC58_9BACT|nr:ARMT1-like domain-containing protein [Kiritimatiella glycovorans]AKJ64086.1 hypothetical protein L21SP4_00823 [Kiritimatiella glycovorans]
MQTYVECIPCFARQSLAAARAFAPGDEARQISLMTDALGYLAHCDVRRSPPAIARDVYRMLREKTGVQDPYAEEKHRSTEQVLELIPELEASFDEAADPLEHGVRLAIAGNIIDFGAGDWAKTGDLRAVIAHALETKICMESFEYFRQRLSGAERILYLGDNCGEVVFDRLLIERLPRGKVTFAVRGSPIINDVTRREAVEAGIDACADIVENGSDAPGTILEDCAPGFRRRFEEADLIISKGQGNYETLNENRKEIFFLLKVKCPVVARTTGREEGTVLLYRKPASSGRKG